MIVSGSASQALAATLARELEESLAAVEYDRFPDGELLAAVPGLADADPDRAVIVASTVSSDAHLEVLQLQDAAREAGVEEVVTVFAVHGLRSTGRGFRGGSSRFRAGGRPFDFDRRGPPPHRQPHETAVCEFSSRRRRPSTLRVDWPSHCPTTS